MLIIQIIISRCSKTIMLLMICILNALMISAAEEPPQWWRSAVYYRLYVDTFKDSNGDGLGDLGGATSQLSYLKAVGADSVIVSPLVSKSLDCSTPGTVDFEEIDPRLGNMDQLAAFLAKAKKLELKVVLTLPIQSVSSASSWFNASETQGFQDWFLWKEKDGDTSQVENENSSINWKQSDQNTKQWASINNEVLLNLCSEGFQAMISSVQCKWLKLGFSGILYDPDFELDNTCSHKLVRKLTLDSLSCARGAGIDTPVTLIDSSSPPEEILKYYEAGANSVISRALTSPSVSTPRTALSIQTSVLYGTSDSVNIWTTSIPSETRISSRLGNEMVDAINLLSLMLPGSSLIQQGDELGSTDSITDWNAEDTRCWPSNPVPKSTVFPWNDSQFSGFSSQEPWVPVASNFRYANAKTEFNNPESHIGVLKVASAVRKSPAFGTQVEIKTLNGALAVLRWGKQGTLLLISNLEKRPTEVLLSEVFGLPSEMSVVASSVGSSRLMSSHVNLSKVTRLSPGETVLMIGPSRSCGGPGPVDKIANKLAEGWQKINKYLGS